MSHLYIRVCIKNNCGFTSKPTIPGRGTFARGGVARTFHRHSEELRSDVLFRGAPLRSGNPRRNVAAGLLILILATGSDAAGGGNRGGGSRRRGVGKRDIIVAEILLRKLPA